MSQLSQSIAEGGWMMWLVLLAAVVAVGAATTALAMALTQRTRQPALAVGAVALVLGIFVPVIGGIGYALAMRNVFAAVSYADPASRAALLAQGISEAMNLIVFGLGCGTVPCVLALAAVIRAATRPRSVAA